MSLSVSITHTFPGFSLDVAFDAPPGVTALFGRSGSGKTTVVNAVAGLLMPDQGRISAGGAVLFDRASGVALPPHQRRLGYVFQDARLFPHLTVRQNLTYGRWFAPKGGVTLEAVVDLLGIGGLLDRHSVALSGGEKQRVAIGRALLSNPRLLLMDEPLAALDEARKAEILPWLERLRDGTDIPILYVSHAMAEVARLATTLVVMEGGRIRAAGPVADMLADPALAPVLGLREAGSILPARVAAHEDDGLTRLDTAAGPVWLPQVAAVAGSAVRIRIAAQDVILSRARPEGLSALNVLPATVTALRMGDGPGALIRLSVGGDPLLVRITRRSAVAMGLAEGAEVFAIVKSVSVAQADIGLAES